MIVYWIGGDVMSRGAALGLGAVLLLITVGFVATVWWARGLEGTERMSIAMWLMAAFSGAGALACLLPRSRPVALRLLGGTVFLACVGYLVAMLVGGPLWQPSRGPSIMSAILCFTVFGIPAGYVAITGSYPHWGKHAAGFGGTDASDSDSDSDELDR
jgi:hypothetical protein